MFDLTIAQLLFFIGAIIVSFIIMVFMVKTNRENNQDGNILSWILFLVWILFYWIFLGVLATPNEQVNELVSDNIQIVKTNDLIILEDINKDLFVFDKIIDFQEIDSTTTFYYVARNNFYGREDTEKSRVYYISNDTRQYSSIIK